MEDEWWDRPGFLFKVCMVAGAVIGAVAGGEIAAGLGAVGVMLGWLAGGGVGAALGYYGAKWQYRSLMIGDAPVRPRAAVRQPVEEVLETDATPARHVERLREEREREAERGQER